MEPRIEVSPNPADEYIQVGVQLDQAQVFRIDLLNSLGQRMGYDQEFKGANERINLSISNLPAGLYWLEVRVNDRAFLEKVIVQ